MTILESILDAARLDSPFRDVDLSTVELHGETDPVYPSPLQLAEGTAGLLGLLASEANAISALQRELSGKTGANPTARIDRLHALLTISSMWVMKVDGELAISKFIDPIAAGQGVFQCADGQWLYLLSGFPHLVEKTLAVLGCTADELTERVESHDSATLERKLVEAQLTGVVMRDHDTWLQHPQGQLLRDTPAVTVEKIGDAPLRALPPSRLDGLRVLDATRVLAGPTCAKTLAALGADVLHVGSPDVPDITAGQIDTGAGKRRAHLDLDTTSGVETMQQLLAGADVFSQSYRAQSLARRGLAPEVVASANPGIIYVTENAYGDFGPWREKRGFDGNVQAATGISALHDSPGAPIQPTGIAIAMNDYNTGYWAAYGVLNALRRRASEGGSWHVRVSLAQTARWFMRLGAPHDKKDAHANDAIWSYIERYSEREDCAYGSVERLRFPIEFSDGKAAFGSTVMPGSNPARW